MPNMLMNPVIIKEVRERFRTGKTPWILGSYLFIMGAMLLGYIYLVPYQRSYFRLGDSREMFVILSVIQLGMIGFIAPALTAGTISGERERQTLNILLTTHLTPFSIVWSKLVTSLAFIAILIITSFPLYSFVFLYGGVSPNQLGILLVFFAINVIFYGALGTFCSAWFKRTGVSTIVSYGIAFIIAVGTGLLGLFLAGIYEKMEWDLTQSLILQVLFNMNPAVVFGEIIGERMMPGILLPFTPWIFYTVFYFVMSIVLLFLASYLVNPIRKRWSLK